MLMVSCMDIEVILTAEKKKHMKRYFYISYQGSKMHKGASVPPRLGQVFLHLGQASLHFLRGGITHPLHIVLG
jgi:hypothetical protein